MSVKIDWDNHSEQISSSYRMTDDEVEEALNVLKHAMVLYDNLDEETPEKIVLLSKTGTPLYTITTKGGKSCTVETQLSNNKLGVLVIVGIVLSVASCVWYYYS
jgi:hypothetical protein